TSEAARQDIVKRAAFSCTEDLGDPTAAANALRFPFELMPAAPGTLVWHRMRCTFSLRYGAVDYTSPVYTVNQLDVVYADYSAEPGVAFENYDFGNGATPAFRYSGRYVQPLDKMLRRSDDSVPVEFIAGVNGGYDYRVDAWSSSTSDNICPPRSSPV